MEARNPKQLIQDLYHLSMKE